MTLPPGVRIVERSPLARLAACWLRSDTMAMVLGRTIHLHGVDTPTFLANTRWVRHELAHVDQYRRMGFAPFLLRYIWWSLRYGYHDNPLEQEARAAESSSDPDSRV